MPPVFIYWPVSNSEQLVVKYLVQGHLDGTLQKIPPLQSTCINQKHFSKASLMILIVLDKIILDMEKYGQINLKIRSNKCSFQIKKHASDPKTQFSTFILLFYD